MLAREAVEIFVTLKGFKRTSEAERSCFVDNDGNEVWIGHRLVTVYLPRRGCGAPPSVAHFRTSKLRSIASYIERFPQIHPFSTQKPTRFPHKRPQGTELS